MRTEFDQKFLAAAIEHSFMDEIAALVRNQAIGAKDRRVRGLIEKMRLIGDNHRQQPIRILERHQAAGAGRIACKIFDHVQKRKIATGDCEGFSPRLVDVVVEYPRAPEIAALARKLPPKRPFGWFARIQYGRRNMRTEGGRGGHRSIGDEDEVVDADRYVSRLALCDIMQMLDARAVARRSEV